MISRWGVLILAVGGILFSSILVMKLTKTPPPLTKIANPPSNPYSQGVSGTGIIEAREENLEVGSPVGGIVEKVCVDVWQEVKEGDPLFVIDTRELNAKLQVDESRLAVSRVRLCQLEEQFSRLEGIEDIRAVSVEEKSNKRYEVERAKKELEQLEAECRLTKTLLEKHTIRAPRDGTIIQVNVKKGEDLSSKRDIPPILMGNLRLLQVRTDIDEQNAWMVKQGAKAVAFPKNQTEKKILLEFVRVEPYITPKRSLTGMSREKVDTRVLQVIYSFVPPKEFTLYVGQQVNVFIDLSGENE